MNPIKAARQQEKKTKKEITKQINETRKTLTKDINAYVSSIKDQVKTRQEKVASGEMTKIEYSAWLKKELEGKQWQNAKKKMTGDLYDSNKAILNNIHQHIAENIAAGANNEAFEVEKDIGKNLSLIPVDEETIEEWMDEDPDFFPVKKLNREKDQDWNGDKIESNLTTAILLGIGIGLVADYVSKNVMDSNENYWMDYLFRTNDSARNTGKDFEGCQAEENGAEIVKQWEATLDFKTRDAHRELDGQIVPLDEPFVYDGDEIWYPHDPAAPAYLVCNCRCSYREIRRENKNVGNRKENIRNEDGEKPILPYMTYDEWFSMKQEEVGGADKLKEIIDEQKREQRHIYYERRKRRLKNAS